jgi:predicted nuclease of predicted toxin-antitoxin system
VEIDFPDSKQVRHVGLEDAADTEIFDYAGKYDFTIVTFDADFFDLSVVKGPPPKVIWLRTGNMTTKVISQLLSDNINNITQFLETEEQHILELSKWNV